ncbi:MAG: hypothetical protein JO073_14945 [Actinobacteria bacterium]|nr:hypothetical protein [Actinomycetota bacterium]
MEGWHERLDTDPSGYERAVARVRADAEALGATQFEAVTAAAFADFAARGARVAAVEAGLGGRHDATNVIDARVVLLTNVGLEHTDVLGETREAIAAEKLAVVKPGTTVVLGDDEWRELALANGAAEVIAAGASNLALAVAAAESFLGRQVDPHAAEGVALAGRLERRAESPLELWDGAHNLAGLGYLLPRLPEREWTLVVSILEDKRPALMLEALSVLGGTLVATESSNARAVPAAELAELARLHFEHVEAEPDPRLARQRGLALAGPDGACLVTGSLYLLSELHERSHA